MDEPLCQKDENFANDVRAIFEALYNADAGSDFDIHTDANASTTLGGWYVNGEIFKQLGDVSDAAVSTLTTTSNSFKLTNDAFDGMTRTIEVTFAALPILNIALVTGATFNIGTNEVMIYYVLTDGSTGSTIGTVVDEETPDGATSSSFLNMDCMCDERGRTAVGLEILFNELLNHGEIGFGDGPIYE